MYILTFTLVRSTLDDNAAALLQLMVLALGTFIAGVSTRFWRVGVVGIVLLLAVPVVSWIEMSSALIVMSLVALLLVVGLLWMTNAARTTMARRFTSVLLATSHAWPWR